MDTFTIILLVILAIILLYFAYLYKSQIFNMIGWSQTKEFMNNNNKDNKENKKNTNNSSSKNKPKEIPKEVTIDNISQFSLTSLEEKNTNKYDNLSFLDDTKSHESFFLTK